MQIIWKVLNISFDINLKIINNNYVNIAAIIRHVNWIVIVQTTTIFLLMQVGML